jgi:vacuolar-type H+-ATPase subunit D/Vma8
MNHLQLPKLTKAIHDKMLENIRDVLAHRFASYQDEIDQSYEDCQKLLNHAYQKMTAQQLARHLPFDIIPLLKRIKKMVEISSKNHLVDVVIPAFNAERYIDQTLESIALQGSLVHSIIVVNDGSTDQTALKVEAFTKQNPRLTVKLINQANAGLANARNTGIRERDCTLYCPIRCG